MTEESKPVESLTKPIGSVPEHARNTAAAPDLERTVKEQRWQQVASEVNHITDRLGMPVDEGIKETVVALNILGINTTGSCEGHLDRGTGAPWVDVGAKGEAVQELEQRMAAASRFADRLHEHTPPEQQYALWAEYHRLRREVDGLHLQEARKAMEHLDAFYRDRAAPLDRRLILTAFPGASRIESQGAMFQETAPSEERQRKLAEYRAEMDAFTAFLKDRYFGKPAQQPGLGVAREPTAGPSAG